MSQMLTVHFSLQELACHSGDAVPDELVPNARRLATEVLEPLREQWGRPIVIISGYRTPAYNKRVGGAEHSTHMTCEAADIRPVDVELVPHLYQLTMRLYLEGKLPALGGCGNYPGRWIHVDIHKPADGHLRRWTGKGIGGEQ